MGIYIPPGRLIYRAVCVDKTGKQILSSYDAVRITFDNRLNAAEISKESYHLTVHNEASGSLSLDAKLYYLPYPSSFANRLGLPKPEPVKIAGSSKKVIID